MRRVFKNRVLERGVLIDSRHYVYVRVKHEGIERKELIGRTADPDVIDRANFRAQALRFAKRSDPHGFPGRAQRLLVEDAADTFMRLHGEARVSQRGITQFRRYVRLIKAAWGGRYVDTVSGDDMRDYRLRRQKEGVKDSTINREQTAIVTLFNRLSEWRRTGRLSRTVVLPETNPGKGVRKVNEDRFIRGRLLSDDEFKNLWACSDERTRRIILAEMNLPLRLADLKTLSKKNINYKTSQFKGIQAKTGHEYTLPINERMWELIQTAPTDQILDFSDFARRWKRAVRRAGLHAQSDNPIQFRDLRRTAATTLHDSGVSLKTISVILGHRAVTTTIRYLGLKNENLVNAGEILAQKYAASIATPQGQIESVPKSVPTDLENGVDNVANRVYKSTNLAG